MDYAQYPPQNNHYNPQGAPGSAPMASPQHNQSSHMQHHPQNHQASPILPSQNPQFQQQGPNGPHQNMYNPAGYANMQQQPFMSPSQAAAMATVAAAGQGNYYGMPPSSLPPHASHPAQVNAVKQERGQPRTPPAGAQMPPLPSNVQGGQPMNPQPLPQRRMSNQMPTSSPHNAVPVPHQNQSRTSGAPQAAMPPPHSIAVPSTGSGPSHPSPEAAPAPGAAEESPLYVNAKQFHRILKRRVARQRLEEALRLTSKGRRPYLHESRHKHAMRRPRGPGGRFLTADEVAEMEKKGELPVEGDGENKENEVEGKDGKKRKSMGGGEPGKKRRKSEDDEEEDDEGGD